MLSKSANGLLGKGIYSPVEAATYARLDTRLVNRWVYGNKQGKRVFHPQHKYKNEKIISFLDFIQILAIRNLRLKYKVTLENLRNGIYNFKQEYESEHPFAQEDHKTYLFKGTLYIKKKGYSKEYIYTSISPKSYGQEAITDVIEMYMDDVHFGPKGMAESYQAFKETYDGKTINITMNPNSRFGEPLIDSCNTTPYTLYEAIFTEGSKKNAAKAFGVDPEYVDIAYRYIDYLDSPKVNKLVA